MLTPPPVPPINWQAVVAIVAFVGAACRYVVWEMKHIIQDELKALDERYVKAEKSTLTGAEIGRRLDKLESVRAAK